MYNKYSIQDGIPMIQTLLNKKSVTNTNERQLLIKMINLMVKVISDFNFKLHVFSMSKTETVLRLATFIKGSFNMENVF